MSILRPYLKTNEVAVDRDVLDEWMNKLHRVGLTLSEPQDALGIRNDIYTILNQPRWTDKQSLTVDPPPFIVTLEIMPDCSRWEASGGSDKDKAWVTEFRAFGNTDNKTPAKIGPIVDRTTGRNLCIMCGEVWEHDGHFWPARRRGMSNQDWNPRDDGSIPALDGMTASEAMWAMLSAFPPDYDPFEIDADLTDEEGER